MKRGLLKAFFIVFSLCFGLLLINVLFNNQAFSFDPWVCFPLMLLFCGIFIALYYFFDRIKEWFSKKECYILIIFCTITAIIQLVCGTVLRYDPLWDLEAIYGGGIEWAETGSIEKHMDYFCMFSNNLGGLTVFKILFSFCRLFSVTDYYTAALFFTTILVQLTVLCTCAVAKRLCGAAGEAAVLCMYVLTVPFFFMGAVFYTDVLSMLFPILTYYLYLKAKESEKKRFIWWIAMAAAAAVGMLIKMTAAIALIAIVIQEIFSGSRKRVFEMAGISAVVVVCIFAAFHALIYPSLIDPERAEERGMPYSHWIVMGLHGNGAYNGEDYARAQALPNKTERSRANAELIPQRIRENGVGGMLELFVRKSVRCFGNGTYALSDFLDDRPQQRGTLHEFVLYDGKDYALYSRFCQGVHTALMLLAVISGAFAAVYARRRDEPFVPQLSVFGLFLFLLMWETSARYIQNYMPLLFLSALSGLKSIHSLQVRRRNKLQKV